MDKSTELTRLSEAVNQTDSTIVITDLDGRIDYVNPAFSRITGYAREEIIGKNPKILNSGKTPPEVFRDMWDTIRQGQTWRGELINRKKDGDLYWERAVISPIKDEAGETAYFIAVKDDISDLKRAEEALRESEKQRETILQTTIEGFLMIDLNSKVIDVNPSMCRILGRDREDIIGISIFDLLEQEEILKEQLSERKLGKSGSYELCIERPDGLKVPCFVNASPRMDHQGNIVGSFAMISDISTRKRVEKQLVAATEAAKAANTAKSQFLANMSHELRTPLNSIIGFANILEQQLTNTLSEKQLKFFNTIQTSSNHLLEMVNDILDLSKIESGKLELDLRPFDLGQMLERSQSIIKAEALKKALKIEVDVQENLGWINGDETKLKQIIYNLLSNAVKFTDHKKSVGIHARAEGQFFEITIWDQGVGIDKNDLETIFDPFTQTAEGKAINMGTGLGLSISKRLIELHHGTISAVSEKGAGSGFIIRLPGRFVIESADDTVQAAQSVKPETGTHQNTRILVTEDNKNNRDLVAALLEDYQLDFAEDGEQALELAAKNVYDLVLMDIQLPGINGVDAMRLIKQNYKGDNIPVIALTAFAMKGDEEKYLNAGFDAYVSKPIELEDLTGKIQAILR